jgi:hypothetical protein
VLAHAEFESAVKDALRNFTRTDLLAGNALLQSRILAGREAGIATPQALRTLLAQTAETLFANDRDQRLYRVLDLTYFHPATKQEAAADRLGMPFSTYRRHLTAGVERLTEWMWQRENDASQTEITDQHGVDTVSPQPRPRLSIVILPFLNLSGTRAWTTLSTVSPTASLLICRAASWVASSFRAPPPSPTKAVRWQFGKSVRSSASAMCSRAACSRMRAASG